MSSSWLIIPGEACSSIDNDWGCPPDDAEVLRVSYLPLLFVMPDVALGGVEGICGDLKDPSFVAVKALYCLFFVYFTSSFTSSSNTASAYFLDIILNLIFFWTRNPSF
jgi:hypothetical protein